MPMCFSHKPSGAECEGYKLQPGNPDPSNFQIIESFVVNGNTVVLVKYPGALHYEGTKILLFQGMGPGELYARRRIDPHFSKDASSPFARFEPTAAGWAYARALATSLPPGKGYRETIGRCPKCRTLVVLGRDSMCGDCAAEEAGQG